jgi:WD40 repeat protein
MASDDSFQLSIPPELRCPISGNLMEEPVIAEDGHTYDKKSLQRYLQANQVSPVTGEPLVGHVVQVLNTTRLKQIKWWKALETGATDAQEVSLTLRRIGEQVRTCREGHKNGANELVYLEDEMALIIENLQKLRRNQSKLENLKLNSSRVVDKLRETAEQKESLLRQEAAVEDRLYQLHGAATLAKSQLTYQKMVLLTLEAQAKKLKTKPVFKRATPVSAKDEKKEAKEDKKLLKAFLKVTDTIEKELNPLVAEEKAIGQKAVGVRAVKKSGARRQVIDEVEELLDDDCSDRPQEECGSGSDTRDGPTKDGLAGLQRLHPAKLDRQISDRSVDSTASDGSAISQRSTTSQRSFATAHDLERLAFSNQTNLEELQQDILGDFMPSSKKLNAHRDEINVVLTTPDGRLASGADDACIYIWNPRAARARPEKIKAHSKAVWALQVVMRKGIPCIASGSWDGGISLWAAKNGKHKASMAGHKDAVFRLAVLPDGALVSASWDATIRLWDPDTSACLAILEGHQGKVRALGVLPDGRIVSAGDDRVVRIWEGDGSRGGMRCGRMLFGHDKPVECLAVLLDGRLATGSQDQTLRVWDVDTGECMKILQGHTDTIRTLQVLRDGFLASGSKDKSIRIWHVNSGTLVYSIEEAHDKDVVSMTLMPSGRLVSCGWDKALKVWNFPVRRE